jgi:hypothetical protein
MTAPLYTSGLFGEDASLLVAVLIGIGFGFFLERAGFGSARKLVAQFYLTDLAVFKVMFTAIVTAMLGLALLSSTNVLDLSEVYLAPTYWAPQIAGGLLLGAGFVIGGYCPGTSIAAAATGRIDGMVCALGMGAGTLTFAFLFPWLQGFYLSGSAGELTLPQLFALPHGLVVSAVVAMAFGGFYAAAIIERRFGSR